MATKKAKHVFIQTFGITIMVLALVRCVFPGVASAPQPAAPADNPANARQDDESEARRETLGKTAEPTHFEDYKHSQYLPDGAKPHPIRSVSSYAEAFPDSNHVQLEAAHRWGVPPVKNRADAEKRKNEVVYMGASPYYAVARLDASIPYLVPRAAMLLEDIGRAFFDSLQVKGLPLHRMVVSSVLRSEDDVARLRRSNKNATEQSCHLYGTTFDINYNQYQPVNPKRAVPDDQLKFILSEVLNDLRHADRCYIKYEVRQPCFHITVR